MGVFVYEGFLRLFFKNEFGKGEKKEKKQICKCLALGPADGGPTDEKKKRKLKRQKRKKEKKRERDPAPPPPGLLLKA